MGSTHCAKRLSSAKGEELQSHMFFSELTWDSLGGRQALQMEENSGELRVAVLNFINNQNDLSFLFFFFFIVLRVGWDWQILLDNSRVKLSTEMKLVVSHVFCDTVKSSAEEHPFGGPRLAMFL